MKTILVVDDDAYFRRVVVMTLNHHGYQTLEASDGMIAVTIAQDHADKIQLAIVDRLMPGMSGEDTIDALRETLPGLPIIFASGDHEYQIDESSGYGGCAHLDKPFETVQLLDLIDRTINSQVEAESYMSISD